MTLFFKSRRTWTVLLCVACLELSLPLWAGRAIVVAHDSGVIAAPLSVLAQAPVVAISMFAVSPLHDSLELLASRDLRPSRCLNLLMLVGAALSCLVPACALIGQTGTLDAWAPCRAIIGLTGAGLLLAQVVDARLAGLAAPLLVAYPVIFDPQMSPGGAILGFVLAQDALVGWVTSACWFAIGAAAHVMFSGTGYRADTRAGSA